LRATQSRSDRPWIDQDPIGESRRDDACRSTRFGSSWQADEYLEEMGISEPAEDGSWRLSDRPSR
jgi:hypothetical protein